jgi:hypothetical protein
VAAPTFGVSSGSYTSLQTVTISTTTAGAAIYYTTDGSTPTASSRVYGGPVSVASTIVLKAIATASGYADSEVASGTYTMNAGGASLSGLPILSRSGVHKPVGAAGGLKVLDWAGFKSAATYTFDDSLPSQISNYPQLQATGVRMTFFLIGASDYDSPTWAQAAKDGHELGNHTEHHCLANGTVCGCVTTGTECTVRPSSGSIETEYDECTAHIKQTYGVGNVWTTAAPHGDSGYNPVAKTRFFLNRGVGPGQIAPNDKTDPYALRVYPVDTGDTASIFNSQIDSAHSAGKWLIFMFHSLGGDGGYHPVEVSELTASVTHAQSLGDVWIDNMVNVGAYWSGQDAITNGITTQSGNDTVLTWSLPSHFPSGKFVRVTVTGGTLMQGGSVLPWNDAGYYEIAIDPGSLTISR